MSNPRPCVLICEELPTEAVEWARARAEVVEAGAGEAAFDAAIGRASALVVRTYTRVGEELLARAPNLRVVGRAGVGVDNIDLQACARRGVRVVHTPGANTHAVTELVFACVLDVVRPRPLVERGMATDEWRAWRESLIAPRQLAGMTLGVYGCGRVGSSVARVGGAFGMRVLAHDLRGLGDAELSGGAQVDRQTLLRESDVLSVHVDDRPGNRGMIGEEAFGGMRAGVVFVNTSRGFVVDPEACAAFLRANPGATAILDVHDPEPVGADSPLLGLANARLTPHIGAATAPAKAAMGWVVRDVWRVLSGEEPEHEART